MASLLVGVYLIAFAVIAGGSFALMFHSLRGSASRGPSPTRRSRGPRHPEAPLPGEEVLVVDLSRERLEQLYRQAS